MDLQKRLILSLGLLIVLTALTLVLVFLRIPFLGTLVSRYDSSKNPINLDFKYGYEGRNELNTFTGAFTKDLVADGTATTWLILSREELSQIQNRLSDIGFFNYPDIFPSQGAVTPRTDYYLRVQDGSTVKEVTWYQDSLMDEKTKTDLTQLYSLIVSMIKEKLEYKLLPPANGGWH